MPSLKEALQSQTWTRPGYLITTNSSLISVSDVNAACATPDMYWAKPLPDAAMRDVLSNSLSFGVFAVPSTSTNSPSNPSTPETPSTALTTLPPAAQFIGIGRIMTDFNTMAYLTDIYILPSYQKRGLGRWMLQCMQASLEQMPYLRGSMLFTGERRSVELYEEVLGMKVNEFRRVEGGEIEGLAAMLKTWKGSPFYGKEGH